MEREIDSARVYCEQRGAGRDILLLHGWGCSVKLWEPLAASLAQKARVTALDFPGHGRSSPPPVPWGVPEYAHMVEGLVETLGIRGCAVVAHSFGARVAIWLAAQRPGLLGRLVLTGAAGLRRPPTLRGQARGALYKALRGACGVWQRLGLPGVWPQRAQAALRRRFGSADYNALDEEMRKTFVRVVNLDLRPCLPKITSPTLLYWGESDTTTPLWMGRVMEKDIPDAGLVVAPGATHFAYLERAEEFERIVSRFLLEDDA
ncbi:MAG: alpha/beta hydrolase [Oscillospiraceae bacterium]|jgi:pimeloyl-ACP methyl ester carboxylesterase|nr:alpha/beta hydrolase [Oscillospiraceae bacterium]